MIKTFALCATIMLVTTSASAKPRDLSKEFCGDKYCGQFEAPKQTVKTRFKQARVKKKTVRPVQVASLGNDPIQEAPRAYVAMATKMLPHPPGCPSRLFCGCGASLKVFGHSVRSLWLARAWFKFPRTSPQSGAVGVRVGHVFVLDRHVSGNTWMVYDYNSGGRKSRYHARPIAGYTIVNPKG